ncbi:MAG: DUF2062 domain-containing protein [Bacteroidales bacterium]|nr:DUF2062 domain-containing protein [Bacteroidales bacterium]
MIFELKTKNYFKYQLWIPILGFLKQGITPEKLSLTIVFGVVFGIFPIIGFTTILCLLAAFIFRLNKAVILLINFSLYPLQILLIIPLIRLGKIIFGYSFVSYSVNEIINMFKENWIFAIQHIWFQTLLGILAWLIISIPLSFILYYSFLPVFKKFIKEDKLKPASKG